MKYTEAHNWLENKQRLMTENRWAFQALDVEANGKAIEAIEKLIPRKPLPDTTFEGICPSCGVHFLDRSTNFVVIAVKR